MSNVWLCIPSAASAHDLNVALTEWIRRGYFTAILRDWGDSDYIGADVVIHAEYKGYAHSVNTLCQAVAKEHPEAEWFVTGGDDIRPDPSHHAHDIAKECTEHFGGTLGIMEPTGDRWLEDANGLCSPERACIAPWMGREWVDHGYGGKGPFYDEYYHFFADEELKLVAERLGILWHRPDLTQYHDNWQREAGRARPRYLEKAVVAHDRDERLFQQRRAGGFPGSGLL
jgi:hypothetical protein